MSFSKYVYESDGSPHTFGGYDSNNSSPAFGASKPLKNSVVKSPLNSLFRHDLYTSGNLAQMDLSKMGELAQSDTMDQFDNEPQVLSQFELNTIEKVQKLEAKLKLKGSLDSVDQAALDGARVVVKMAKMKAKRAKSRSPKSNFGVNNIKSPRQVSVSPTSSPKSLFKEKSKSKNESPKSARSKSPQSAKNDESQKPTFFDNLDLSKINDFQMPSQQAQNPFNIGKKKSFKSEKEINKDGVLGPAPSEALEDFAFQEIPDNMDLKEVIVPDTPTIAGYYFEFEGLKKHILNEGWYAEWQLWRPEDVYGSATNFEMKPWPNHSFYVELGLNLYSLVFRVMFF